MSLSLLQKRLNLIDPAEVKHQYNLDLVNFTEIKDADCLVFAVAHNEFKALNVRQIDVIFKDCPNEEKVIIDIKSILNKENIEELGYSYWRL